MFRKPSNINWALFTVPQCKWIWSFNCVYARFNAWQTYFVHLYFLNYLCMFFFMSAQLQVIICECFVSVGPDRWVFCWRRVSICLFCDSLISQHFLKQLLFFGTCLFLNNPIWIWLRLVWMVQISIDLFWCSQLEYWCI